MEHAKNEELDTKDSSGNEATFIVIESHDEQMPSRGASKEHDTGQQQLSECDVTNQELRCETGEAFPLKTDASSSSVIMSRISTRGRRLLGAKSQHLAGQRRHTVVRKAMRRSTSSGINNITKDTRFVCSMCSKIFRSHTLFSWHFSTEHQNDVSNAGAASARSDLSTISVRRLGRSEAERTPANCDLCGKCFRSARCLAVHQLAHRGIKPFLCDECGRGFHAQATLSRHVMLRHTERRPFVCDRCGKGFVARSRLARHAETHDPSARGRHSCHECGASFANAGNLLRHRRLHSDTPRPYACDKCGRSFTQKTSLSAHAAVHDPDARRWAARTCPICGKTLSKAANLGRHLQRHHRQQLATNQENEQRGRRVDQLDVDPVNSMETAAAGDNIPLFTDTYVIPTT